MSKHTFTVMDKSSSYITHPSATIPCSPIFILPNSEYAAISGICYGALMQSAQIY